MSNLNKTYHFEQRTAEWHEARAGIITSSEVLKIMKKSGLGVGGNTYCSKVFASMLQQNFIETYSSYSMQQGVDREPIAQEIYEEEQMVEVTNVGFIVYGTDDPELMYLNGFIGISPDGLVGEDGGLEIKCPEPPQHGANLIEDVCSDKYHDQIQTCLFVTGRKWWDLMTFNPDFKDGYKWKITRNYPDENWQFTFKQRAKQCKKIIVTNMAKIKA
jgi:hypothetical protein